jgi:hypothetical protein
MQELSGGSTPVGSDRRARSRFLAADWWPVAALVLLALATSFTSLWSGFAYDDNGIIKDNARAHALSDFVNFFVTGYWPRELGGSLYRPLTIARFAVQWTVGGGSPLVFHAVNLLLYVALTLTIFGLAQAILAREAAWLAAALFAVHPVHVESVGNAVGQSELMVALCLCVAVLVYLRARRRPQLRASESIGFFLLTLIAAFSKENGIVLPALLAAAEFTVVRDERGWRKRLRVLLPTAILLALAVGIVIAARHWALDALVGEHPFFSLSGLGLGDRSLTVLGIVPIWTRLLLWPAHLQADYGPPDVHVAEGWGGAQTLGLALLVGSLALALLNWRRRPTVPFGLLWLGIALLPASNLLVATGILLAERTLLLPSVGTSLVLAALAHTAWQALSPNARVARGLALLALTGVLVAGVLRSGLRQLVWRDTETLIAQTVLDAPRNYRAWEMFGNQLASHGQGAAGRKALDRAAALYDKDPGVFEDLGRVTRGEQGCSAAIPVFERVVAMDSRRKETRTRLYLCLLSTGDTNGASILAAEGARLGQWYFQLVMAVSGGRRALELPAERSGLGRESHRTDLHR